MIQRLEEELFNKIQDNATLIIFGACDVGLKILRDINTYKPTCKIIGFIDNYQKGTYNNLPIYTLKSFIDSHIHYDYIVMATRSHYNLLNNIFELYEMPVIKMTPFLNDYYRDKLKLMNTQNLNKCLNIFQNSEDKELYQYIFDLRTKKTGIKGAREYYDTKYRKQYDLDFTVKQQYLEKINKNAVEIILDIGLNTGLNVIAYNKLLPHLKKTYGFEVIYEHAKVSYIEDFILNEKLEIIPYALGDKESSTIFWLDKINTGRSFCEHITDKSTPTNFSNYQKLTIPITTINKYCTDNNIKPDFIKMDIEGAELSALKGGIETIKKYRPQLAISIYHSNEDFINIPLYLNRELTNYNFAIGHYSPSLSETVLYAIPKELA